MENKVRENKLRRKAKRLGLFLKKSRAKYTSVDNWGGYMILDLYHNTIDYGERFDLSLDDVEKYLSEDEEELRNRQLAEMRSK
jgi:hypothetical protein